MVYGNSHSKLIDFKSTIAWLYKKIAPFFLSLRKITPQITTRVGVCVCIYAKWFSIIRMWNGLTIVFFCCWIVLFVDWVTFEGKVALNLFHSSSLSLSLSLSPFLSLSLPFSLKLKRVLSIFMRYKWSDSKDKNILIFIEYDN